MFVHGPSRICTHPSSIPIETFAFVFTGGKTRGWEKVAAVDAGARVTVVAASEIFGPLARRTVILATPAATINVNKALMLMLNFPF
jgi:hypothetical protein